MRLLLELLRDEHNIPLLLQAQVLSLLEDCGNVLSRIEDILMQCHGADEWVCSGRAKMAELRGDIETYRRALGLVLDVVNYHQ